MINSSEKANRQRRIQNGKVAKSDRTVWRLSEDDIIDVARERGALLTEVQLDVVSEYVDKHFAPNGEWHEAIDAGLDSIGIPVAE